MDSDLDKEIKTNLIKDTLILLNLSVENRCKIIKQHKLRIEARIHTGAL